MSEKPTLNIVLVEPRIPQNTGNVARTCACTACRLHLVGPMGFAVDDKSSSMPGWITGTTSTSITMMGWRISLPGTKARSTTLPPKRPSATPTSSTRTGPTLCSGGRMLSLPEALLAANQEHCIRMPMRDTCRSLNLSNSVAVGVYEVLRQWDFPELLDHGRLREYEWK